MQSLHIGSEQILYSIKKSSRARNVRLTISSKSGLQVIVPQKFNERNVPAMLADKEAWILRHLPQLQAAKEAAKKTLPSDVYFAATDECWAVEYDGNATWGRRKWTDAGGVLRIAVDATDHEGAARVLQDWLRHMAQDILTPWLEDVAQQTELPFRKVTIRNQKTRWGSCSRTGTINLNQKLLFLEPDWVEYILVHELCHTKQLNHSAKFWKIVEEYLPDARKLDKTMRKAAQSKVPWWAEA